MFVVMHVIISECGIGKNKSVRKIIKFCWLLSEAYLGRDQS